MKLETRAPFSWRDDPSVPQFEDEGPVTVMDAQCGLCARGAAWIAHGDRAAEFRIVPVQTPLGRALLNHFGLDHADPASWLYLEDGRAFTSIDAIIRVGQRLGGMSGGLVALRAIPRPLGDGLYGIVARNRYRFMGHADLCNVPDPEVRSRLLS